MGEPGHKHHIEGRRCAPAAARTDSMTRFPMLSARENRPAYAPSGPVRRFSDGE